MKILVLNCGSSSIKYQLLDMETESVLAIGKVERVGMEDAIFEYKGAGEKIKEIGTILDHTAGVRKVLKALTDPVHGVIQAPEEIAAVGHRVVHGGEAFVKSVIITDEVKRTLRELFDLAPLHNPANLTGILAAEAALPHAPGVAVFDTAFHATMPRKAFLYALPYAMYKRHKVRRYGFHGTSHKYVSQRAADLLGRPLEEINLITCHLGNGSSITAVQGGKSVDTSMGFTPLAGLIMGTRAGDLDPGVIPYIMAREEIGISEVNSMLNKHSGILGISGISSDMRQIEEEMEKGDPRAVETFEMMEYRLRKYIGAYAAVLGRVDGIVFTGGIGENSPLFRKAVCQNLGFLGVTFDEEANNCRGQERIISGPDSKVAVMVIPTNEELMIARETAELIRNR
ncbi:acetate/propionate family kinase [Symbiobacterium thermophilum]|uniref:Acetate kinase n=1 Tax=Symbiobacterium thermophilum TaxID=2734 RepID=A0A953LIA7_SYMTR|nr:acetate kinase [Symbiobacterium thermophilum]MBY6275854.1 acetate kinase [Symbiobacterium thermophilum]